jgi:EAL domain-containing protein (putative c-di-GMP-specific phosphodiesterase class I)
VKLDRSLVAGLESDPARQAMIVGLRHFALATGCRLIAEGVETEAELSGIAYAGNRLGAGVSTRTASPHRRSLPARRRPFTA